MNFQEYWADFKKHKPLSYNYDEIAMLTWQACKEETLKILKDRPFLLIDSASIEKIEKL